MRKKPRASNFLSQVLAAGLGLMRVSKGIRVDLLGFLEASMDFKC